MCISLLYSKKKKYCLLGLIKKKKETKEIKFIDVQEPDFNNHITNFKKPESPTVNIVHFAEQEDDTDLTESIRSNPADVVRKHLLPKVVSVVVHPHIVRGRLKCDSAVRFIFNYLGYGNWSQLLNFKGCQLLRLV